MLTNIREKAIGQGGRCLVDLAVRRFIVDAVKPRFLIIGSLALGLVGCQMSEKETLTPRESAAVDYVDGALAYHRGDKDVALDALRRSIVEDPDLIMARVLLGQYLQGKSPLCAGGRAV